VVGPRADEERIPGIDLALRDGQIWMFGEQEMQVLDTPGHTRGDILFFPWNLRQPSGMLMETVSMSWDIIHFMDFVVIYWVWHGRLMIAFGVYWLYLGWYQTIMQLTVWTATTHTECWKKIAWAHTTASLCRPLCAFRLRCLLVQGQAKMKWSLPSQAHCSLNDNTFDLF